MGMRIASKRPKVASLRPPLAYAADLLRVCLRDKAIAASLIACQALLLMPMLVGFPINEEAINRDRALSMLGIVRNELSAYKDEFPEELYDLTQQQYRHYSDAVAAKYPSKEFFRAMAAASEVEDVEQRAGYLTGDNMYSAYAKLFDGLANINGTPVYATAADLPALVPRLCPWAHAGDRRSSSRRRRHDKHPQTAPRANPPCPCAHWQNGAAGGSDDSEHRVRRGGPGSRPHAGRARGALAQRDWRPRLSPCPHNCRRHRHERRGPGNLGGHRPSCPGGCCPRICHVRCWQGRSDRGVRRRRHAMRTSPAAPLLRQLGAMGRIRVMASHHLPQA